MCKFIVENASNEEAEFIDEQIVAYNAQKVPFTQEPTFIPVKKRIRDEAGEVIAGLLGVIYCWKCCYIDVLWVREDHRGCRLGSTLLAAVEKEAKVQGCHMVHLDTFDFQAREFYMKQGYEVFGVLEDCPPGHKRFYLAKRI